MGVVYEYVGVGTSLLALTWFHLSETRCLGGKTLKWLYEYCTLLVHGDESESQASGIVHSTVIHIQLSHYPQKSSPSYHLIITRYLNLRIPSSLSICTIASYIFHTLTSSRPKSQTSYPLLFFKFQIYHLLAREETDNFLPNRCSESNRGGYSIPTESAHPT